MSEAIRLLAARVTAVTGADRHFGNALAQGLADAGSALVLAGQDDQRALNANAEALRDNGAAVAVAPLAASDRATLRGSIEAASRELGGLDALVHARVPVEALAPHPITTLDDAGWDARCEGVFVEALAAAQVGFDLLKQRGGAIVFVAATHSLAGAAEFCPYAAATEAIRAMARSGAKQWGQHGIRLNCIAPSLDMLLEEGAAGTGRLSLGDAPLPLTGDPRYDVAPTVALLASEASANLTGASLRADGGVWMAG